MHQQGMETINWPARGFSYRNIHYQRHWASITPSVILLTLGELSLPSLSQEEMYFLYIHTKALHAHRMYCCR